MLCLGVLEMWIDGLMDEVITMIRARANTRNE